MSLVELMVAMALGLVLVGGALSVHVQSNDAFQVTEKVSRLQENGRFALDTIIPDMRLSGYWGETEQPAAIARRTGDPALSLPASATPANDCYAGSFVNVIVRIEAANEDQTGVDNPFAGCVPDTARLDDTDMLIVRHAAATPTAPADIEASRVYLISSVANAELFVGGNPIPAGYSATDQIHAIVTNIYYISPNSSAGNGIPSLRRQVLAAGPALIDEELITGAEDLQVQLGIDTDADLSVNSYLNPGNALIAANPVVSARVWLRLATETGENGFTDGATYDYADISIAPGGSQRRVVVSKTVQLRNGRGT